MKKSLLITMDTPQILGDIRDSVPPGPNQILECPIGIDGSTSVGRAVDVMLGRRRYDPSPVKQTDGDS